MMTNPCILRKASDDVFFKNYATPGPGVKKRDPNASRMDVFRDVFPRKLWNLFKLNILYVLVSVPFMIVTMLVAGLISSITMKGAPVDMNVTTIGRYDFLIRLAVTFLFMIFWGFGPATAAFIYIIRQHACERPCLLISDFFEAFKSNFKRSMLLWLMDLAVFYLFTVAFCFYAQSGNIAFQYIILLAMLVVIMMHLYLYRIMITFDLSFRNILKNSFFMAMGKAPVNLLILLCNIIIYIVLPIWLVMSNAGSLLAMIILLAEVVFFPSITNFITSFYMIPMLETHMSNNE